MRRKHRLLLSCLGIGAPFVSPALAQQIDRPASVLDMTSPEYQPLGLQLGKVRLEPEIDARLEYDSNIYAEASGKDDDWKAIFSPRLSAAYAGGAIQVTGRAAATLRRYFSHKTENSEAGLADLKVAWRPNEATSLAGSAGWDRAIEDRGDPEARDFQNSGPRRIDILHADLQFMQHFGRIGFDAQGEIRRLDHVSAIDAERDHDAYASSVRLRYRISGLLNVFGQGFVSRRDFRLAVDSSGINRDSTTYGARTGIAVDPGGTLRGDLGVGIFRFDPSDPQLKGRTGLSFEGSMIFQPTQRMAFTLGAFQGDVATLRTGALARTDTRIQLGAQMEARHNLRLEFSTFYRRSNFIGSGVKERTIGGMAEAEYLFSRRLSVAATLRYGDRSSDDPSDDYKRLRGGVELRLKF